MPAPLSESVKQILARFDEAWNGPTPPCIEDHLAAGGPDQRLALLIELIRRDLERRLAAGERLRLEEAYLRRFPELYAETSALITLVKHEFELRRRNQPDLRPAEYLERFPQCQTELWAELPTGNEGRDGEQQQEGTEAMLPASAPTELDGRRYELIEAVGKGGMGEVYRCCDPALHRDLAIKVMKASHQGHPEAERRFLREARVTGSLQHPGIVPVHNLGRLADGRLHYTMRLVRGRTFADILREEAGKPERLPYLLTIFEKICQAVAYAHSKRVIHRDLKPHNVMVGRFGEVQVMDWGLAKVLTAPADTERREDLTEGFGTAIHAESADTPLETRDGMALGTLPYMPPEQALGEWDAVDERADVFALGSILCVLLTGQPAYCGADGKELYRRVRRGDVVEALERLQQCGAEAALTALCRECLSPRPEGRPRDADVVAKRVAAYQAEVQERLRRAEVERTQAQLKAREERKRRRLLIVLVLVLLAGVFVSSGLAVWATRSERKARELEEDANAVLDFFQERVFDAHRLRSQQGGDEKFRQALDEAESEVARSFADRPRAEAAIRSTLSSAYWFLGDATAAIQQQERALALREATIGRDHPDTLMSMADLALLYRESGRLPESVSLLEEALDRAYKRPEGFPSDLDYALEYLAEAYNRAGQLDKAEPICRQLLDQARRQFGSEDPRTAGWMAVLGLNLLRQHRYSEAETLLRECLQVRAAKQPEDWATFNARSLLGGALLGQKHYAEAEPLLLEGYEGMKARQAQIPPPGKIRLTEALQRLVQLYEALNKTDEAARWRKQLEQNRLQPGR